MSFGHSNPAKPFIQNFPLSNSDIKQEPPATGDARQEIQQVLVAPYGLNSTGASTLLAGPNGGHGPLPAAGNHRVVMQPTGSLDHGSTTHGLQDLGGNYGEAIQSGSFLIFPPGGFENFGETYCAGDFSAWML